MTQRLLLIPLLALPLTACFEKSDDDDDTGSSGDDSGIACGSTQGFVYGTVYGPPWDEGPVESAQVLAWYDGIDEAVRAEMAGDGSYELNLEGGREYYIYAYDDYGCYSPDTVLLVEECEEYALDITIEDCDVADKPNLYLYPEHDTQMTVELRHTRQQALVATDPFYQGAWRGIAHSDGTWTPTKGDGVGERFPFLFYEVSLAKWQSRSQQRQLGWCVAEEGAAETMAEILGLYGFDAREREDFVEAWQIDLPPNDGGYAVYPQLNVDHMADVDIHPALPLSRLWLTVEPGEACDLQPPHVVPFDRSGAHAVEWGVVLHGLVR